MKCYKCLSEWKSTVNLQYCPFCQADLPEIQSNLDDFTIEDGVLVKYKGTDELVSIPNTVNTLGKHCFSNNRGIIEVIIPDSVVEIGICAFDFCTKLVRVHLPDSLVKICDMAFSDCFDLESITLPNSLEEIGDLAFMGCTSFKKVTIPDSVTKIGEGLFQLCENLTEVDIPYTITAIPDKMFGLCNKLTEFAIPEWITEVGFHAFRECQKLETVILLSNVELDPLAFIHCSGLKKVIVVDTENIGDLTIYNMHSKLDLIANVGVSKARLDYYFSDERKARSASFNKLLQEKFGSSNIQELIALKKEKELLEEQDTD